MIVIIIGVLAALRLPVGCRVKRNARSLQCKNNLHELSLALKMYTNENNGLYPDVANMPSAKLNDLPSLRDVLDKYSGNPQVFKCPNDNMGYFQTEGTSHECNVRLANQLTVPGPMANVMTESRTSVPYDCEDFHGPKGTPGSRNFVYLVGHIEGSLAPPGDVTPGTETAQ